MTTDEDLVDEIAQVLADHPLVPATYAGDLSLHEKRARTAAAVLPLVRKAQERAWEDCAAMAAHHGAFDGARARWLSSMNPYREEQGR